jgi:periplasmic protein TonB
MAVEIVNFMPDVEVHRGEPPESHARSIEPRTAVSFFERLNSRAAFIAIVVVLHVGAFIGFVNAQRIRHALEQPRLIEASFIDEAPAAELPPPPVYTPPEQVVYQLPMPDVAIAVEADTITPPPVQTSAITNTTVSVVAPPLVESVEYVRTPLPVYPRESSRRREHGTVLLRVLVDASGRAAQVQLERSSGYERLDHSALEAVRRWLFRPHEVNGTAQSVQVLVPVEFARRSS